MSKPRTVITSIGNHGEKIVNRLIEKGLLKVYFLSQNELIDDNSLNIFILFIIYNPKDGCIEDVNKIIGLYVNNTVIEIILTDRIERKTPHYVISNLLVNDATKEISTLITAYNDLGKFPSQASLDMADIIESLKNVNRFQMKEFTFETSEEHISFSQLNLFLRTLKNIKTVWIQFYLEKDDGLLFNVLENVLDAVSSNLGSETKVLWNVSYGNMNLSNERDKCILLFC